MVLCGFHSLESEMTVSAKHRLVSEQCFLLGLKFHFLLSYTY